jgi:hypothetical protein
VVWLGLESDLADWLLPVTFFLLAMLMEEENEVGRLRRKELYLQRIRT